MGWKGKKKLNPLIYERLVDDSVEEVRAAATPKGYVPVLVGGDGASMERFLVSVKLLNDPCMSQLLEKAEEELGEKREGVLRITCDVGHFQKVVGAVSRR